MAQSMRVPAFAPSGTHVTVNVAITPAGAVLQFDGFNPQSVSNQSPSTVTPINKSRSVRLYNAGPSAVFFELVGTQGDRAVATNTGVPLSAGATEKFTTNGATYIAATVAPGGSATLYATPGEGL